MVSFEALTNAMVNTLRLIPQLVADLDGQSPDSIIPYIDVQPKRNAVRAAIYGQKPGTVLAVWQESIIEEGDMEGYLHRIELYLRAQRDQSVYTLVTDIVNGVPDPGDGLRWIRCPVMEGVLPTTLPRIARETDAEQIDLIVIYTETKETGDA